MKKQLFILCLILSAVFTACKEDDDAPPRATANFDFTNCEAPCTVNFINISQNATSYSWNFGDGTTSTEINPKHLYEDEGTYTVKLEAVGEGGNHIREKDVVISPPVFHLKYKADGVLIEAADYTASRNIPTGYLSLISNAGASAPPYFNFVIEEPTNGFQHGFSIDLNMASAANNSYASHIDVGNTTYSSMNDTAGIKLIINYIEYLTGGIMSATFSGSVRSSSGTTVQITEGSLKMTLTN